MPDLQNPHDHFFKALFSQREAAQDFLKNYLPADLIRLFDLTTLDIRKDSFVDPELQSHFSDILYKIACHDGLETYIYLLFEHKSYPDPQLAFQLLRYLVRIWEQDRQQQLPLRPIVPLVLYHGHQTWTTPLDFRGLFDLPTALQRYIPQFEYQLYDLSHYSDEEIRGEVILRVSLLLLKYISSDAIGSQLKSMVNLLRDLSQKETGLEYLYTLLRYVAGATDKLDRTDYIEVVEAIFEQGDEAMPTLIEQWKKEGEAIGLQKGREEGLVKGLEQGLEEGQRQATLTLLRRFLHQRFGTSLDQFDDDFASLDLSMLTQLSDAAFEAQSLSEFMTRLTAFKQS